MSASPNPKNHSPAIHPLRSAIKGVRVAITKPTRAMQLVESQVPTALAIVAILSLTDIKGSSAGVYTISIILLLLAVIYSSMRLGLWPGLSSAAILTLFNAYILHTGVKTISLSDPGFRVIALIGVVLPFLALVIGRLKERNDSLLKREQTARLLAEGNEQRLRFMAESMPQKIFTTKPDGSSEYVNRQWSEYIGAEIEEVMSIDWARLIHPEDSAENIRRWQHSLETGEFFEYEHRLRRADGTYRWHLTRAQPMRDDKGEIILWVGSSTDIEQIRRTRKLEVDTARLTKQRAELLALNTAKDEFISLASHQLRTPATGVKQYLGMVLEGYGGRVPAGQLKLLKKAYASNERQLNIVDDLLKVAQVDAGKVNLQKEKVDLVGLISDVIHGQAAKFKDRDQKVIFRPRRKNVTSQVDTDRLRMVLENILDNAGKYSSTGKTIEITLTSSKSSVKIAVRDEGVGIDPRQAQQVFDKFSRLDNPLSVLVGGTGLGLYWAKKIIDLHDGSITIDSTPGKGSVFTITLPA